VGDLPVVITVGHGGNIRGIQGNTVLMFTGDADECLLSNSSSEQPDWHVKYRGDYKGITRPVCSHDLFCWAFQVARGMEYLASRKVRQILLICNIVMGEYIHLFMVDYTGIIKIMSMG
jgi:hypothetical protein